MNSLIVIINIDSIDLFVILTICNIIDDIIIGQGIYGLEIPSNESVPIIRELFIEIAFDRILDDFNDVCGAVNHFTLTNPE